jgi:hypothetical protein
MRTKSPADQRATGKKIKSAIESPAICKRSGWGVRVEDRGRELYARGLLYWRACCWDTTLRFWLGLGVGVAPLTTSREPESPSAPGTDCSRAVSVETFH